jgi:DOPA 4,5-dioxygenase
MSKIKRPVNIHKAYHAHVYYERESSEFAAKLCIEAGDLFDLSVGYAHQQLVGPHPMWSCQITFGAKHFDKLIPWLEENRNGLTVFVHGMTGDDIKDHTDYAYWLGDSVDLNLSIFGI